VCACHDAPCTAMSQVTTGALATRKSSGRQQASPVPLNRSRSSAGICLKDITASRTEERSPARGRHRRHWKTCQPFDQTPPSGWGWMRCRMEARWRWVRADMAPPPRLGWRVPVRSRGAWGISPAIPLGTGGHTGSSLGLRHNNTSRREAAGRASGGRVGE
jgi:hypothetical protein